MPHNSNILKNAELLLRKEAQAILDLIGKLNETFLEAVNIIYACKGRAIVMGMGKSGLVGRKISATLASTGTPSFFVHPAEASHGDLGMITSEDVIIAISNSGETEEIVRLLPFFKRFNVKLISLTGNGDSTLAKEANINIDVSVKEEACPLGIAPTSSTTATMAMGDAIAISLLMERGFKENDFALFHPGGSIGKRLFISVKDLMYTGDELPLIAPHTLIKEAIVVISTKRLGCAVVVGEFSRVVGILTDGDLRRGIEKWGASYFDMTAETVMSINPKTISETEMAVKALAVMQEYSITSLVVPDDVGRIRGIIHLHDIIKKGII
ncbi:KpsF/GutQ family protein [Candidatus Magnetoovum chiemensis]|nr:KpsF/GutQ family protein [Candidatus Magnetoovum chiemensis]